MDSYSVRCILRVPREDFNRLKNLYEERINVWKASSADQALDKAIDEARKYTSREGFEYLGIAQCFHMFKPIAEDGIEVFSLLRESDLDPEEYLDSFFTTGHERQQRTTDYV